MTNRRKLTLIALALIVALGAFGYSLQRAAAVTPGLYLVDGNPNCGNLYNSTVLEGPDDNLLDLGPLFGFKYDGNPTGDLSHTLTNGGGWVLTGSSPADPNNSVSIFNVLLSGGDGVQFDWSATLGIDAVIVKAQDANAYVYSPEAFGASGLLAPANKAISHVEFCYDYELTAEKTAETSYTRTYTWDITKDFDATYDKFIGDAATSHGYQVSVDQTVTDSDFAVSGSITVKNPTPFAVTFSVSDVVDGVPATVTCDDYALAANDGAPGGADEETCTYTAGLLAGDDGTNVATVTSLNGNVDGAEATADYAFGDPTTIVGDPEINVSDTNGQSWTASGDDSWTYDRDFVCSDDPADYTAGFYTFDHVNTATIVETNQSDTATVTVNCYAPVVTKDASASYDETWTWTLDKTVDPDQSEFAGNDLDDWTWTVTVSESSEEGNFAVTGSIYVNNPAGSPGPMTVSLADQLNDGTIATVDCGAGATSITVAAGAQGSCSYTASPADRTATENEATGTFNGISGFEGTAGVSFDKNVVNGTATVADDEIGLNELLTAGDAGTRQWTATEGATCSDNPADYADDGKYSVTDDNTATLTSDDQNLQADADTTYTCYAPVVTKDASASYDETWTWTLDKTVDPDQSEFAGNALDDWTWTVTVGESSEEGNFAVSGNIYVDNPAGSPGPMTVSLADQLNDGTIATVDCGAGATSVTVAAGAQGSCSYTAGPDGRTATENKATGTFNGISGFEGTAGVTFEKNVVNGTATVADDEIGLNENLTADDGGTRQWTATEGATCSSNPADYADDGKYSVTDDNTATLTSDDQNLQADADTTYTCYAPVVTKDASASYDETWTWTLAKSVDPLSQSGAPGDLLDWTWTVTVGESSEEGNFAVSGNIYVDNPAGSPGDMIVSLVDQLNDGTFATVDCGAGATSITVAAGAQGSCSYTASPADRTATENKATGTFNGISGFEGTADVTFVKTVVNGTATVDDDQEPDFPVDLVAGDNGVRQWTETQSHTCSTDRADYIDNGSYSETRYNTATLTSDDQSIERDADTTYTCSASFVDVLKTTNGEIDPTRDIRFRLYDADGNDLNDEVSTFDDVDGQLQFQTALVPDASYTICEAPVPAGYTFEISVDGGNVLTYAGPPGAENPTGEIQCFDFTAAASPTTLVFEVNNSFPGGAPRTPGYWKNWNTCTTGNQAQTAEHLGGTEEGVFLLDDLLPQLVGDLLVTTCEDGVNILDSRDINNGNKKGNDGAYILARSYLAALLNQNAGACDPDGVTFDVAGVGDDLTFQEVLNAAQALLDAQDFDGTGNYLGPRDRSGDRDIALALYAIIDDYNNGEICTGEPSH